MTFPRQSISAWISVCLLVGAAACSSDADLGVKVRDRANDEPGGDGDAPPAGVCCEAQEAPGCIAAVVEQCVCEIDDYCCTSAWDDKCVQLAIDRCGSCDGTVFGPPTPVDPTPVPQPTPNPPPPTPPVPSPPHPAPPPVPAPSPTDPWGGDCCWPHDWAGCDSGYVTDCACGLDPFCCDQAWDDACVELASRACDACGVVARPTPTPIDPPRPAPTPWSGACCYEQEGPFCDDVDVVECVCASDAYCCEERWDAGCAAEVSSLGCGACGVPPQPQPQPRPQPQPLGGGPCCAAHDGVGCAAAEVTDCVCSVDSYCCSASWDELCVEVAISHGCGCGDVMPPPDPTPFCPVTDAIGSELPFVRRGETFGLPNVTGSACGGDSASEQAFQFIAPVSGTYVFDTRGSSFDTVLSVNATDGCVGPELRCNDDSFGTLQSSVSVSLSAGQAVLLIVDGFGDSAGEFTLRGELRAASDLGACCAARREPACGEPMVEQCVCDADPYCCEVAWDASCVARASECGFPCGDLL